jgi:outer membrane protein OmpA-like peptidoglycan-associated protein
VGNAYKTTPPDPCKAANHTVEQCPNLDDDGDGITNGFDKCPTVPEDKDGFEDEDGCPELDNDKDGIPDAQDKCRDVPGVFAFEGCTVPDADHDTVMDADDQCPTEPGPVSRQGCPFRDTDNDGVEDSHDKCPTEAGLVELKGCPEKDTDGDGVADHLDNCPNEKGVPENQGCPKKKAQLVVITRDRLVIKDKVYFATGKSKILPRSFPLLNQVAEVINGHPEIARVVVEGHTDSVGKADANRKLSQERASAVMTYLVGQKVDSARLSARGYGPDKPAATNDTAAGREQNRGMEGHDCFPSVEVGALLLAR